MKIQKAGTLAYRVLGRKDSERLQNSRPPTPAPPAPPTHRPRPAGTRWRQQAGSRPRPRDSALRQPTGAALHWPIAMRSSWGRRPAAARGAGLCGRTHVKALLPTAAETAGLVCGGWFGSGSACGWRWAVAVGTRRQGAASEGHTKFLQQPSRLSQELAGIWGLWREMGIHPSLGTAPVGRRTGDLLSLVGPGPFPHLRGRRGNWRLLGCPKNSRGLLKGAPRLRTSPF